jgi:hypothetical protein
VQEPAHSPAANLLENEQFVTALRQLIDRFSG